VSKLEPNRTLLLSFRSRVRGNMRILLFAFADEEDMNYICHLCQNCTFTTVLVGYGM
jgi:hypothetical protein